MHKGRPRPCARCRNINLLPCRACCPPIRGRGRGQPPAPGARSRKKSPPAPEGTRRAGAPPFVTEPGGPTRPQAGRETDSPDALRNRLTPDQHLLSRNHPPRVTSLDGPQGACMSIRYYYQDLLPRPLDPPVKEGVTADPGYHPTRRHWRSAAPP